MQYQSLNKQDFAASIILHVAVGLSLFITAMISDRPIPDPPKVTMVTAMGALPRKGPDTQEPPSHVPKKHAKSTNKKTSKKKVEKKEKKVEKKTPPKADQMKIKKKEEKKEKKVEKKEKKEKKEKVEKKKKAEKTNISEREKLLRELERKKLVENVDGDAGKKDVPATAKNGTTEKLPKHGQGSSRLGNAAYGKYKRELIRKIRKNWFLVPADKAKKVTVTISFTLDSSGTFSSPKIVKSSGKASIDSAALRAVSKTGRASPPPEGFGTRIKLTLTSKD